MTVVFLLGVGLGAVGGGLGCHRWHRARTADAEIKADMCDWFRDVADRKVDLLAYADRALRLPRKRRIPGDTR